MRAPIALSASVSMHYGNAAPFGTLTSVRREVDISPSWITVEEHYDLRNDGAGAFIFYDDANQFTAHPLYLLVMSTELLHLVDDVASHGHSLSSCSPHPRL